LHIIKNKFNTKNRGAPKSVGPVAIATPVTIVNQALVSALRLLHMADGVGKTLCCAKRVFVLCLLSAHIED